MDTIFPDSVLRSRAIDNETMWRVAYASIIATEALIGFLLALGAVMLLSRLRASAKLFNDGKRWAVAGLTLGFALWCFGFIVTGGEYFAMWQSHMWNGVEGAFRFVTMILGVLIFVSLPDTEVG
jgi:predicted small integral membrane protein